MLAAVRRPQAFDVTGTWSGLRGDGGTGGERLGVVLWVDRDWAALEGSHERVRFAGRAQVGEQCVQGGGDPLGRSDGVVVGGAEFGCLSRRCVAVAVDVDEVVVFGEQAGWGVDPARRLPGRRTACPGA